VANRIYIRIEVELAGRGSGWTDISADLHGPSGIDGARGLSGDPIDRVATTGVLTFTLINSTANSAGLLGYYSPGHANLRSGFAVGIGVRASAVLAQPGIGWIESDWIEEDWIGQDPDPVVTPLWTGQITRITPGTGQYLSRLVLIECRDYIEQLASRRLSGLAVAQGIAESDAFQAVIDEMPIAPRDTLVTSGPDTFNFAFDLSRDERTVPLQELQRIAVSTLAVVWLTGEGTLVYEPRNQIRADPSNPLTPDIALTEADLRNALPPEVDDLSVDIINKVQTIVTPRSLDIVGGLEVLYRAVQAIPFGLGVTEFRGLFTDPDQRGFRAGGIGTVAPVASTDYVFNTEEDDSGTDITAQVAVTSVASGNSVLFTVNNQSGRTAWATTLQSRGYVITAQERITLKATDDVSIAAIGENPLTVDMVYQSNISTAQELAYWLLHVLSQAARRPRSIPLWLDPDDLTRAQEVLDRDISDVVSMTETMTALDGDERYFIDAIGFRVMPDQTVWIEWMPTVANAERFWHLGVVGFGELGVNTHLGFDSNIAFSTDQHLTTGGSQKDTDVYTTGVIAPTADALILVWVAYGRSDSTVPSSPTLSGNGLTWVEVASVNYKASGDTPGAQRRRLTLFRSMGAGPAPGAVTITFSNDQTVCSWSIAEYVGVDTGGAQGSAAVVQSASNSDKDVSSIAVTLAAFGDPLNRPAMGVGLRGSDTLEEEGGWTLIGRRATKESIMSAWKSDSTDTSCTALIPGASGHVGAIAVEIKYA